MGQVFLNNLSRAAVFVLFLIVSLSGAAANVLSGVSTHPQQSMEFAVQQGTCMLTIPCQRWIYAYGEIDAQSPARLKALLDTLGDERILVALNSAGGNYLAAIEMGQMLRKHILPATVASSSLCKTGNFCSPPELKPTDAECDFACVLVLLGSATRTAPRGLTLNLPRLSDPDVLPPEAVKTIVSGDGGNLVAKVDNYLAAKALDRELLHTIVVTPLDAWHWVGSDQALMGRVITGFNGTVLSEQAAPVEQPAREAEAEAPPDLPRERVVGLASGVQPPMDFVLFERTACAGETDCGRWISAEGLIGPDTASAFRAFLTKWKLESIPLMINSAGGDYAAAIEIGRIARDRNLKVGVAISVAQDCPVRDSCRVKLSDNTISYGKVTGRGTQCDFACLFILAGGDVRSVPPQFNAQLPYISASGESLLHGDSLGNLVKVSAGPEAEKLDAEIRKYLIDMLWDTELYVELVRPGNDIGKTFAPVTLHRFGLANRPEGPELLLKSVELAQPRILDGTPMQFAVAHSTPETCKPQCRRWIVAEGTITENSPARLSKLLKTLGEEKLPVVLQSEGGSIWAAIAMGTAIRDAGLDVAVGRTEVADCEGLPDDCLVPAPGQSEIAGKLISDQAVCASSCPLVLAGGERRYVSPWSFIIVHTQFTITPNDTEHPLPEEERIVEAPIAIREPITYYLKAMGVKPELFDIMRSASATSFRIVAPDEALQLGLTTHKAPASELVGLVN